MNSRPARSGHRLRRRACRPRVLVLFAALVALGFFAVRASAQIPIIDAHSQVGFSDDMERIIRLMDEAGVSTTILSARRKVQPEQLLAFADRHPGRIVPAVRSKSKHYMDKSEKFYRFVEKQIELGGFRAFAEVLMYHAEKFNRAGKSIAPKVEVYPDDERVRATLKIALAKRRPFIVRIEFAAAGPARGGFMEKLETMLQSHPDHPFALIHMGQLDAGEAARLIGKHSNVYFLTAHTTPITIKKSREPWTNLFKGKRLAPEWKALVLQHPDRFVMAFDNVWENHWGKFYSKQVALWSKALADLPTDVAHALAHRNAEQLWRLPPAQQTVRTRSR